MVGGCCSSPGRLQKRRESLAFCVSRRKRPRGSSVFTILPHTRHSIMKQAVRKSHASFPPSMGGRGTASLSFSAARPSSGEESRSCWALPQSSCWDGCVVSSTVHVVMFFCFPQWQWLRCMCFWPAGDSYQRGSRGVRRTPPLFIRSPCDPLFLGS